MRIQSHRLRTSGGFTLTDSAVSTALAVALGSIAIYLVSNASILYAKNTAENAAHDQNRIAVNRLVRDIHSATSIPQLGHIESGNKLATAPAGSWMPYGTNVTFVADGGVGPAAGISFKKMGSSTNPNGGPFKVRNDPGNKDLIQIDSGTGNPPYIGTELIFPYYNMEGTVNKVTSNGQNHYNVFVNGGLETRIKEKKDTTIVAYYMSRYAYVVEGGELRLYASTPPPEGVTWPVTIARNVCEPPSKNTPLITVGQDTLTPANATIRRGERVRFRWTSNGNRNVLSKPGTHPFHAFASGGRKSGDSDFFHTFQDSGSFAYWVDGKSSMSGVITVQPRNYNATPFSQPNTQYVAVNLTTEDNRYSNRNYKAVNTLLAGSVPIRAQLSKTQ